MTTTSLSRRPRKANKPAKPRRDFPLFAHASGQWAKKVRGKLYYFGTWDDPVAAESKWERDKLALLEGRNPEESTHGDSVGWLCNVFMDSKQAQLDRGELSQRQLNEYHAACKRASAFFGKGRRLDTLRAKDFEHYRNSLPDSWAPTTINNQLRMVRVLFKYGNDIEATDREIRYHIGLKAVSKAIVRKHEAKQHAKEFTAEEIWALLSHAKHPLKAFILLGINCTYGTADIGRLEASKINFADQWLGEPRGKTGMARGAWLWPETVEALKAAIDAKPYTGSQRLDKLAFLTRNRRPWFVDGSNSHPLTSAFVKAKAAAGIDRKGVGHYALRHTFETVAGDSKDQPAVDYIMGHIDGSIAGNYRQGIDPGRIKAVCQHVRDWLLAGSPQSKSHGSDS